MMVGGLVVIGWCGSAAGQQSSFLSKGSGDWNDPAIWNVTGDDEDGVPGAHDAVQIRAGHHVELAPGTDAQAETLNLYGDLAIVGETASSLTVGSIFVRGSGLLNVVGPHAVTFRGGEPGTLTSYLQTRGAARTILRGQIVVEEGTVGGVRAETARTLEVDVEGLEPGALVGARWKFLSGRARLRTFEVVANTASTVSLRAVDGGGPRVDSFEAEGDASGMMLSAALATVQLTERELADRAWAGRWLLDADGGLHLVLGAVDGGEEADRIGIWPPAVGRQRFKVTWGVQAGDRFTVDRPVRLAVSPDGRPDQSHPARTWSMTFLAGSHTTLDRVAADDGALSIRNVDGTEVGGSASLSFVDLRQGFSGCIFETRGASNLVLDHLVVADAHPDTADVAHGGITPVGDPVGRAVCLGGDTLTLKDSLISAPHESGIFAAGVPNLTLLGNIVTGAGAYHTGTHDALALSAPGPNTVVEGNALFGGTRTFSTRGRTADSSITVAHNLLAQSDLAPLLVDQVPTGGSLQVANNLMLALDATVETKPGNHIQLTDNLIVGARIEHVDEIERNRIWSSSPAHPAVLDPSMLRDNHLRGAGLAVIEVTGRSGEPIELVGNTIAVGAGAAFDHAPALTGIRYEANSASGPLFTGDCANLPDGVEVALTANTAVAAWSVIPWSMDTLLDADPTNTLLDAPDCASWWSATAPPDAGVRDPDALPDGLAPLMSALTGAPWGCAAALAPGAPAIEGDDAGLGAAPDPNACGVPRGPGGTVGITSKSDGCSVPVGEVGGGWLLWLLGMGLWIRRPRPTRR